MGWLALAIASPAGAGGCARVATVSDIERAVSDARAAFAGEDDVALAAAVVEGDAALRCIVEPVEGDLAVALHFVHGLWVSVERGDEAAVPYLAAGPLGGTAGLGVDLGDAEWALVARVGVALDAWEPVPGGPVGPPLLGRLLVDGSGDRRRFPTNSPVVVQRVSGGAVLSTDYVAPGGRIPRYVRRRPVIAVASGAFAAGAGGLLAGAALARHELHAPRDVPLGDDEVGAIVSRNHTLLVASGVAGALSAAGLGALTFSYLW